MVHLREAGRADLESFYRLDQVCFPAGIAYSLADFRSLLNSRRTVAIAAEEAGSLAGFILCQAIRRESALLGQIVTIDVAPDFRRRGVGRLLMQQAASRLAGLGASRLRLEVSVENHIARNFYASLGFRTIGEIPNYYPGNLDAVVMEKPLPLFDAFNS
jgi:ribosomal-protein-alanine N-acetyltransferase